jgi:hypothetical protein
MRRPEQLTQAAGHKLIKIQIGYLQRSLSTPTNYCGGKACIKVLIKHARRPAAPSFAPPQAGPFWYGIDPQKAQRRVSGI